MSGARYAWGFGRSETGCCETGMMDQERLCWRLALLVLWWWGCFEGDKNRRSGWVVLAQAGIRLDGFVYGLHYNASILVSAEGRSYTG